MLGDAFYMMDCVKQVPMNHSHMKKLLMALPDAYTIFGPVVYRTLIDALKDDGLIDEEI